MTDICIIGVGKVGGALAIALSRTKNKLVELVTHSNGLARPLQRLIPESCEVVSIENLKAIRAKSIFITTQDPKIAAVAKQIVSFVRADQTVFHTSGSLSSEVFKDLKRTGCQLGSIHPLTSLSDPLRGADQFAGTYFCVEGTPKAVAMGRRLVRDIGGKPFSIETKMKPLYHAAAVTSAGHVTALFDVAVEVLSKCGVKRNEARKIFLPLLKSTVENLQHQAPEYALTGSFARSDAAAVGEHLRILKQHLPISTVELYKLLGLRSVDIVERRSGNNEATRELRELLSMAKGKRR